MSIQKERDRSELRF